MLWVRTDLEAPKVEGEVSLLVSGYFASQIWLNGENIGRNGMPGQNALSEAPGLMDAAFHVPSALIRPDSNELILLISSHHGVIDLTYPFHNVRLVATRPNDRRPIVSLAPILIACGLILAGGVYFGGMALTRAPRFNALILFLLCLVAAGQLVAEIARSVWAYPYPVHGLRLVAIAGFSAGFGLLTCFYVVRRLQRSWLWPIMGVATALSGLALWLHDGFDGKSSFAMLGPLLCAFLLSLYVAWRRSDPDIRSRALISATALSIFIVPNILVPSLFLDTLFFYLVAAFLLVLLAEQIRERSREQADRHQETARADRLQLLLDQLDPDTLAPPLIIRSAGRIQQVPVADITTIQGADGYSEIYLENGHTITHTKSLNALESELPTSFLKVHRSHIVNTAHVSALERDSSGTGRLILKNGTGIPVSRRILPRVREALS